MASPNDKVYSTKWLRQTMTYVWIVLASAILTLSKRGLQVKTATKPNIANRYKESVGRSFGKSDLAIRNYADICWII